MREKSFYVFNKELYLKYVRRAPTRQRACLVGYGGEVLRTAISPILLQAPKSVLRRAKPGRKCIVVFVAPPSAATPDGLGQSVGSSVDPQVSRQRLSLISGEEEAVVAVARRRTHRSSRHSYRQGIELGRRRIKQFL